MTLLQGNVPQQLKFEPRVARQTLQRVARPRVLIYGVIGAITPSTNPTETILNNGIGMLAAGNAVVVKPVKPLAPRCGPAPSAVGWASMIPVMVVLGG